MEIPPITNERIAELLKTLQPVVRKDGSPWYIEPVHPRNVSFTWSPSFTEEAKALKPLRTVRTLHTYGYYGMFKPSIAEVLAQVPADLVGVATAFEVNGPKTAADLNQEKEALNQGFHVAQTTFYVSEDKPKSKAKAKRGPKTAWDRLKSNDEL